VKRTWLVLLCVGGIASSSGAQGALSAEPKYYFNPHEAQAVLPALKATADADADTVRIRLDPPEASQKRALEDFNASRHLKALKIGFPRSASLDSSTLIWRALPDGGRVARFSVTSPEAAALRLGLVIDRFDRGAELRFFGSADPSRIYGPITRAGLHLSDPIYWSPVSEGESVTAEIYLAAGVDTQAVQFRLDGISHLVVSVATAMLQKIGTSEPCNRDVACLVNPPQGLLDAAKAVARMAITEGGDTGYCTGTLLADTDRSGAQPYFYTASHCIDSQLAASSLNTYWFYETPTCGGLTSPGTVQKYGGATLLYTDPFIESPNPGTDAALLVLNEPPPSGAVFAGWDASVVAAGTNVVALHHPDGDLKKESEGFVTRYAPYFYDNRGSFIDVKWTVGSTEGGSSGSGLFVANGGTWYLRGGLLGGKASCSTPQNEDSYSRLDVAFPHIKQYLDPAAEKVTVVEFYNPTLDHYFITYVGTEIAKLENGDTPGWVATGLSFSAYPAERTGLSAVCRIYIPPGKGDGHYYGRDKAECDAAMAKNPSFILESPNFFYLYPTTAGNCAAGLTPVYRVYSNRADANHRYTTSRAVRDTMVAKGWLAEGDGPDVVVMCAP